MIEILVAIVIVSILAAIAFPTFNQQIRKARRGEAQAFLMDAAQRQHQFFAATRQYASTLSQLNMAMEANLARFYAVEFQITAPASTGQPQFTLVANPLVGTSQASDGSLSIDSKGGKTPSNVW